MEVPEHSWTSNKLHNNILHGFNWVQNDVILIEKNDIPIIVH